MIGTARSRVSFFMGWFRKSGLLTMARRGSRSRMHLIPRPGLSAPGSTSGHYQVVRGSLVTTSTSSRVAELRTLPRDGIEGLRDRRMKVRQRVQTVAHAMESLNFAQNGI
jgi:hypothetical protein